MASRLPIVVVAWERRGASFASDGVTYSFCVVWHEVNGVSGWTAQDRYRGWVEERFPTREAGEAWCEGRLARRIRATVHGF